MGGAGGGAWKVAYADFVTAMMAFFMVMWITAQNKQMKNAVAHYFNDPFNSAAKTKGPESAGSVTTGPLPPGSKAMMASRLIGDPPSPKLAKGATRPPGKKISEHGPKAWAGEGNRSNGVGKPTLFVLHNGEKPETGTVLLFSDDSKELSDKAKDQLTRMLPLLEGKRQKIEIRGHARQRGSTNGGKPDVWELSYARCTATMQFLAEAGIEVDRLRLSQAGSYEPRTIREGDEQRVQNSCVEVYVLNEMTEDTVGSREERAELYQKPR